MIQRSFSTLGRNIVPFLAISFGFILLSYISAIVLAWFGLVDPVIGEEQFEPSGKFFIALFAIVVVFVSSYTLLTSTIIYATVQDLRGVRPPIGDCVAHAWDRLLPVIGVTILSILLFGIGFLALIVPGIILSCIFGMAIPAAVVEPSGVMDCFRTSAALTKGNRWRVLGVFVLIFVIELVISLIIGVPSAIISETAGSTAIGLLMNIVEFIMQVLFYALNGVVLGVVYHDLRLVRERAVRERTATGS